MVDLLRHRGPDAAGEWLDARVFMGHRRLSVIEPSAASNQPFWDPSGRFALSYNGELYNYVELRQELVQRGVVFRTASDTEVMLTALVHWKDDALRRFDGMFSAAFHDRMTGRHLLFRDPLGQKPLYYFVYPGGVIYASELRAIISLDGFSWRLDKEAFRRYLMHSYYAGEETAVEGIRKLLPGHTLEIVNGQVRARRYWNSVPGQEELEITDEDARSEFERLFSESCMRSMRSDVPYGVFLSGGIDSSLVLDFCRELNHDIRAFSVAMGEADFDESAKACSVAQHLGVRDHRVFSMDIESVTGAVKQLLSVSDEPHGDPGFVNAYLLARSCRPYLTVGLAGDGGDELFAGYAPFQGIGYAGAIAGLPAPLLDAAKALRRYVPENDRYLGLRFKLDAYLRGFPASADARAPLWLAACDPEEAQRVCNMPDRSFFDRFGAPASVFSPIVDLVAPARTGSPVQRLLYFYQKVFLPEFVCMHTDRAAMQVGFEVRAPFLSVPLVTFANRLPDRMKIRGGQTKWLLKTVAKARGLPGSIVSQRKQGFTFPIARWLKSALKPMMVELLERDEWDADGLVDTAAIGRIVDDHLAGRRNNYRLLYNLMCFRAWRRNYPQIAIDG